MKNEIAAKAGRTAEVVSVSMSREEKQQVASRIEQLGKRIKSRAHYFQLLIEADMQGHVLLPKPSAASSDSTPAMADKVADEILSKQPFDADKRRKRAQRGGRKRS